MRKLLAVAALGVGIWAVGACGGDSGSGGISDPVEACKQGNQVICDKIFKGACFTTAELDAAKDRIGLNAADCATKFNAQCTPENANCKAGETYHADKAQACLDGYKTFTCDDLKREPQVDPAACDQVCTK